MSGRTIFYSRVKTNASATDQKTQTTPNKRTKNPTSQQQPNNPNNLSLANVESIYKGAIVFPER